MVEARAIDAFKSLSLLARVYPTCSRVHHTLADAFVEFPLHSLNMRPHTSAHICATSEGSAAPPLEPLPEQLYDLFGVAVHHGSMSNGHYTSFIRRQAEWFHCDDALVVLLSTNRIACSPPARLPPRAIAPLVAHPGVHFMLHVVPAFYSFSSARFSHR